MQAHWGEVDWFVFEKVCGMARLVFLSFSEILRVFVVRGSGPDAGTVQASNSVEREIVPALLCSLFGVHCHEPAALHSGQATISKNPDRTVSPK